MPTNYLFPQLLSKLQLTEAELNGYDKDWRVKKQTNKAKFLVLVSLQKIAGPWFGDYKWKDASVYKTLFYNLNIVSALVSKILDNTF